MDNFVTDTQALVKFMMGKKVINAASGINDISGTA
jgi:hypothetical protein